MNWTITIRFLVLFVSFWFKHSIWFQKLSLYTFDILESGHFLREPNTLYFTILEPGLFVCWYCKEDQSTAWDLIKHVQKVHGIKCYSEPDTKPVSELDTKPVSSSEENCADLRRRSRSPEPPKAKALKLEDVKKLEIPSAFQSGTYIWCLSSCVFSVFHSHKIIVDF